MPKDVARGALLGLSVGDALGVPHEFRPRHEMERNPVVGMDGWGTWNHPPGTFSEIAALIHSVKTLAEPLGARP